MKTYRWLLLPAAVAITFLEVLLFTRASASSHIETEPPVATPETALSAPPVD